MILLGGGGGGGASFDELWLPSQYVHSLLVKIVSQKNELPSDYINGQTVTYSITVMTPRCHGVSKHMQLDCFVQLHVSDNDKKHQNSSLLALCEGSSKAEFACHNIITGFIQ